MQEDLAIEFPSKAELPGPLPLPGMPRLTGNADGFTDFFLPEIPRLHFRCTDPMPFPNQFDSSIQAQLSAPNRILEQQQFESSIEAQLSVPNRLLEGHF